MNLWEDLVVNALSDGALHPFAIRLKIEQQTAGVYSPSSAILFETIAHLLDAGVIERGGKQLVTVNDRPKLRQVYRLR